MGKTDQSNPNTKDLILDTALELFANQGYHKSSISQIARKVGVSKSLIYNYFESKEDLLEHIVTASISRSLVLLPEGGFHNIMNIDDLSAYLKNVIDDLKIHSSYYRLLILLTLQGDVKQKLISEFMKVKSEYFPQLIKVMENHRIDEPEKMTYLFGACLDGLILHYLYMEDEYPIDEVFFYFTEQLRLLVQPKLN